MLETIKFISRVYLVALLIGIMLSAIVLGAPYLLDKPSVAGSIDALASADRTIVLYEVLRILLKLLLGSVIFASLMVILELAMITFRGKGIKAQYLNKVQTEIVKSKLAYDELFDVCEDAVMNCGARVIKTEKSRGLIEAETKSKLTGLTERIVLALKRDGRVLISSRTTSRFASLYQTSTLGRNVKNLRLIIGYMEKHSGNLQAGSFRKTPKKNLLWAAAGVGLCAAIIVGMAGLIWTADGFTNARRTDETPMFNSEMTIEETVREGVRDIKEQGELPMQIGEGMTLVDVTEEKTAIRYHVLLSDQFEWDLDPESIKTQGITEGCGSAMIKDVLNHVDIEYLYTVEGMDQQQLVVITKADCSQSKAV